MQRTQGGRQKTVIDITPQNRGSDVSRSIQRRPGQFSQKPVQVIKSFDFPPMIGSTHPDSTTDSLEQKIAMPVWPGSPAARTAANSWAAEKIVDTQPSSPRQADEVEKKVSKSDLSEMNKSACGSDAIDEVVKGMEVEDPVSPFDEPRLVKSEKPDSNEMFAD